MSASWSALYPFESCHLELDGGRLHYLDEGRATAGSPLLFVHGNPTWSFYWRRLVEEFRETHRCVAVDHIGCGLSDKPQQYAYTLAQHTDNLVRLIDELDLRDATLLAHDWGGAIGLGAVVARRERFNRVVLFNTGAFPPPRVPKRIAICRTPGLGPIALRGLNLFAKAALSMAVERPLPVEVRQGLLAPYDSWAHRVAIWHFVRDIPFTRRHPTWSVLSRLEDSLRQLDLPVKLIWGMRDWCFDAACLERFETLLRRSETTRLEQAGHYVIEDAADEVISEVRQFLEGGSA